MKTSTIVVALAVGCGGLALAGTAWRPTATQPQPPVPTEAAAKARGSIHDVDLRLIGADGRAVSLDQLRGHPVLVSMFFGSCPSACPLLIRDLKQLVAQLPDDARARLRVLLISFDPQHDTPAILADVYRRHDLDSRQWILSTPADEDSVRVAAGVLRIRYRPTSEGQFDHTRRITLLDGDGHIRAQSDELAPLAQAVRELTPVASR
jgi:protein SCO1/2